MRLIPRFARRNRIRKPILIAFISLLSTAGAVLLSRAGALNDLNELVYDRAYELRHPRDSSDCPIVIVAANETSLREMASGGKHWAWPWPRQFWGKALDYVQSCGAKAAAVDLLFPEPSQYNGELGDDATFAEMLDSLKMPVILAVEVNADGTRRAFAPPVKRPAQLGAVNLLDGAVARDYMSVAYGTPSMGLKVVRSLGVTPPAWAERTFRLHYYGRHLDSKGGTTYPYVAAANVFEAMLDPEHAKQHGIDPEMFRNKIVLFGATATALYDLKSAPLDATYPGVEIHATAIENLLKHQRVRVTSPIVVDWVTLVTGIAAAAGASIPRRASMKLLFSGLIVGVLLGTVAILFRRSQIIWLPPMEALVAIAIGVLLSISWSYFAQDRESRFFLKALGQYVSPQVAAELKSDPSKLAISTAKGELTILFSDIVGFTTITEQLDEGIGPLLNFYLDEMSQPVLAGHGTLDKYIGDAIMSFWNAPVAQPDHAERACRTALAMRRRLAEIQPRLAELGAPRLDMRIGINTGICAYGNMGSRTKFNYSIIGDACNFASRLEGANKIYDSHILIGESTRNQIVGRFVLRKIDVLRVKGKQKPQAIYELMGEGLPDEATATLITQYELAFRHYSAKEWDAAEKILIDIRAAFPEDGPSKELLNRVAELRKGTQPEIWDGVFVAKEK